MTKQISQGFSFITLAAWGGVLLFFAQSGRLPHYLVPAFRPFVAPAAWTLLAMALLYLVLVGLNRSFDEEDPCRPSVNRLHLRHVLGFLLLMLPIGLAVFVPPGYTAEAVRNKGFVEDVTTIPGLASRNLARNATPAGGEAAAPDVAPTPQEPNSAMVAIGETVPRTTEEVLDPLITEDPPLESFIPKNANGDILAEVVDLLFAAEEPTLRPNFEGKSVEMIGQLMPLEGTQPNANRFRLMRMFMVCCAADAQAVAVTVETPSKVDQPEMSWVRATGVVEFERINGKLTPILKAKTVVPSDPPEETMLF